MPPSSSDGPKKRGRPRKVAVAEDEAVATPVVKKKPGRPRKEVAASEGDTTKPKRAPPTKRQKVDKPRTMVPAGTYKVSEDGWWYCIHPKCDQRFKHRNYLSAHVKAEHEALYKSLCASSSLVRYDCDWSGCDQSFEIKTHFTTHMARHNNPNSVVNARCRAVLAAEQSRALTAALAQGGGASAAAGGGAAAVQGGSEGRDEVMGGKSDGDEAAAVESGGGRGEGETSVENAATAALVASMEVFELFECSECLKTFAVKEAFVVHADQAHGLIAEFDAE